MRTCELARVRAFPREPIMLIQLRHAFTMVVAQVGDVRPFRAVIHMSRNQARNTTSNTTCNQARNATCNTTCNISTIFHNVCEGLVRTRQVASGQWDMYRGRASVRGQLWKNVEFSRLPIRWYDELIRVRVSPAWPARMLRAFGET